MQSPSRWASCVAAAEAMPTSGPPQLETARRRSSGLMREQYITGAPGRVAPTMTKLASTSACCWARQPAMLIGPVAPSEGAGSEWKGMPASAITMMAAVTFSVKISGLTGKRPGSGTAAGGGLPPRRRRPPPSR